MSRQSRAISYAVLYLNLYESKHNSQRQRACKVATDIYTIDIVIALLNTVCFVNISIPKAKGKYICEEFKFVHESIMTSVTRFIARTCTYQRYFSTEACI